MSTPPPPPEDQRRRTPHGGGSTYRAITPAHEGGGVAALIARMQYDDPMADVSVAPRIMAEYQGMVGSARRWVEQRKKRSRSSPEGATDPNEEDTAPVGCSELLPLSARDEDVLLALLQRRLPPTTEVFNQRYRRLVKIGEGAYGDVFIVYDTTTTQYLAMKRMRMLFHDPHHSGGIGGVHMTIVRELRILSLTRHENIIPLVDYHFLEEGVCVVLLPLVSHDLPALVRLWRRRSASVQAMELNVARSSSLLRTRSSNASPLPSTFEASSHLARSHGRLPLSYVKCLIWQLLQAVYYLHSWGVWHRDLKMSNVMVHNDGRLVVVDFGWSRFQPFDDAARRHRSGTQHAAVRHQHLTGPVGTVNYRAPEVLIGGRCSHVYDGASVDLWAVGCIAYELIVGEMLIPGRVTDVEALERLVHVLGAPDVCGDGRWYTSAEGLPERMAILKHKQRHRDGGSGHNRSRLKEALAEATGDDSGAASAHDFVAHLLEWDPKRRMSARRALEHPWWQSNPVPCNRSEMVLPETNSYSRLLDKAPASSRI